MSNDERTNGADTDDAFQTELDAARTLLDDDTITAFHVGVVRDDTEVDTTFASRAGEGNERDGLQTLSLLATHLRVVASDAGVDYETVAADAVTLANQVEEAPFDELDEHPDEDGSLES